MENDEFERGNAILNKDVPRTSQRNSANPARLRRYIAERRTLSRLSRTAAGPGRISSARQRLGSVQPHPFGLVEIDLAGRNLSMLRSFDRKS